jgi:3-oxoadipate CoA-transferase beta subunit
MMDLLTKKGESKLVSACTYPLTGVGCVSRIYSDLATLTCGPQGLTVIDMVDGLDVKSLSQMIGLPVNLNAESQT